MLWLVKMNGFVLFFLRGGFKSRGSKERYWNLEVGFVRYFSKWKCLLFSGVSLVMWVRFSGFLKGRRRGLSFIKLFFDVYIYNLIYVYK